MQDAMQLSQKTQQQWTRCAQAWPLLFCKWCVEADTWMPFVHVQYLVLMPAKLGRCLGSWGSTRVAIRGFTSGFSSMQGIQVRQSAAGQPCKWLQLQPRKNKPTK